MVVGISVPFAKGPGEDIAALAFLEHFEASLRLLDVPFYTVKGSSPKTMLNLSTSEARSTEYSRELSSFFEIKRLTAGMHIRVHTGWVRNKFRPIFKHSKPEQMLTSHSLRKKYILPVTNIQEWDRR